MRTTHKQQVQGEHVTETTEAVAFFLSAEWNSERQTFNISSAQQQRCMLSFGFVSDELCFHWVAHNISNKCTCIARVIDIRTTKLEFQRFKLIRCQSSVRKWFDSIQRLLKTLASCHQTQFSTFSIKIWTDEHIRQVIKVLLTEAKWNIFHCAISSLAFCRVFFFFYCDG